ncbi:unnamed protein product [Prorocentrum cordatum]|uniref:K Homology domain-containing protein n=1 Tax=Prorocentrum cordatum TaxID=2364126 RepID=A0ABN9PLD2_9DINO|nr:unnamed protein product [Polarella glacialis]
MTADTHTDGEHAAEVTVLLDKTGAQVQEEHGIQFDLDRVVGDGGLELARGDRVLCHVSAPASSGGPGRAFASRVEVLEFSESRPARRLATVLRVLRRVAVLQVATSRPLWSLLASLVQQLQRAHSRGCCVDEDAPRPVEVRCDGDQVALEVAVQVRDETKAERDDVPYERGRVAIDELRFTHAVISGKFRDGRAPEDLLGELKRGRVALDDDRLTLDVVRFRGSYWSLNNRRLWVLKRFQQEYLFARLKQERSATVPVRIFRPCRLTASFILAVSALRSADGPQASRVRSLLRELARDPEARAPRQPPAGWGLPSAEERQAAPSSGQRGEAGEESERVWVRFGRQAYQAYAVVEPQATPGEPPQPGAAVRALGARGRSQAAGSLRALCPVTAKLVLAHSTENAGDSVQMRPQLPRSASNGESSLHALVQVAMAAAACCGRLLGTAARDALAAAAEALLTPEESSPALQLLQRSALARVAPSHANLAAPLLREAALGLDPHGGAARHQAAARLAVQLAELYEQVTRPLLHPALAASQHRPWHRLLLVPERFELEGARGAAAASPSALASRGRCTADSAALPSVLVGQPYPSAHAYFDTYFRLLREDGLAAMRRGVARELASEAGQGSGEEAPACSAAIRGVTLDGGEDAGRAGSQLLVVVEVQDFPAQAGRRPGWAFRRLAPSLMPGNLCALLLPGDGAQSRVVWALVACADAAERRLLLGLYRAEAESMQRGIGHILRWEHVVLLASPAYFRSYEPVLAALQREDPEEMPFREELVACVWPEEPQPRRVRGDANFKQGVFRLTSPEGAGALAASRQFLLVGVSEANRAQCFRPSSTEAVRISHPLAGDTFDLRATFSEPGAGGRAEPVLRIENRGQGYISVARECQEREQAANEPGCGEAVFMVPSGLVGKVIGRKGTTIKLLQAKSGASLAVEASQGEASAAIRLSGAAGAVAKAQALLQALVGSSELRGGRGAESAARRWELADSRRRGHPARRMRHCEVGRSSPGEVWGARHR